MIIVSHWKPSRAQTPKRVEKYYFNQTSTFFRRHPIVAFISPPSKLWLSYHIPRKLLLSTHSPFFISSRFTDFLLGPNKVLGPYLWSQIPSIQLLLFILVTPFDPNQFCIVTLLLSLLTLSQAVNPQSSCWKKLVITMIGEIRRSISSPFWIKNPHITHFSILLPQTRVRVVKEDYFSWKDYIR